MCNRHRGSTRSDVYYGPGYKRKGGQGIDFQFVIIPPVMVILRQARSVIGLLDI